MRGQGRRRHQGTAGRERACLVVETGLLEARKPALLCDHSPINSSLAGLHSALVCHPNPHPGLHSSRLCPGLSRRSYAATDRGVIDQMNQVDAFGQMSSVALKVGSCMAGLGGYQAGVAEAACPWPRRPASTAAGPRRGWIKRACREAELSGLRLRLLWHAASLHGVQSTVYSLLITPPLIMGTGLFAA